MSAKELNNEDLDALDYEDPAKQEPLAEIDPAAIHDPSVSQAWQPIIIQTSAAAQEPAAQSSIDRESLTLTVQDK
jgi:hypothetical protein